jgi:branched-chain amino acid transport system substrate-binding protein
MMVVALNTSPLLATLPHPAKGPRLLWRTTYNTVQTVPAISAFVEERLEPQIRSKHLVSPGAPLRVALLRRKNAAELAFSDALFRGLSFNGKSALDNTGNFREFVCGEACAKPDGGVDPSLVDGLLEFAPQIVIISGVTEALIDRVLAPLERRLPRTAPRPDYVNIMVLSPAVFRFVDSRPDLRARFFGLTVVSNTAQNARFVMHYNETFDDKITRTISPNTAYDAFYLLAYATYAVGSGTVTGATLAGAMTRLVPPGDGVDVGPSTIFDGFNALTAGRGIDFVGATGPLDFNVATGEAPVDMIVLCVGANARGEAVDTVESGLVYRAAERRLDGAMRCP